MALIWLRTVLDKAHSRAVFSTVSLPDVGEMPNQPTRWVFPRPFSKKTVVKRI